MKLPLVYAQVQINTQDPGRERPFEKSHQDFQHNMKSLAETGSATTNGGWTCRNTVGKRYMQNGTVGGKTSSSGE